MSNTEHKSSDFFHSRTWRTTRAFHQMIWCIGQLVSISFHKLIFHHQTIRTRIYPSKNV